MRQLKVKDLTYMTIRVKAETAQGEKRPNMDHLKEAVQRSNKYDEMEEMANTTQPDKRCRCGVRAEGCDGWEAATAFRCSNRAAQGADLCEGCMHIMSCGVKDGELRANCECECRGCEEAMN